MPPAAVFEASCHADTLTAIQAGHLCLLEGHQSNRVAGTDSDATEVPLRPLHACQVCLPLQVFQGYAAGAMKTESCLSDLMQGAASAEERLPGLPHDAGAATTAVALCTSHKAVWCITGSADSRPCRYAEAQAPLAPR